MKTDIFLIIRIIGCAGFMLFGIRTMKNALEKSGSGALKKAIELCTKNDFAAVISGTLVTALVQSSAAITVTVVGLVDSKKLPLRRAIGVILGANVGTCVTGWLTGLAGINSESAALRALSAQNIAFAAAAAGAAIYIFSKRKNASEALLGFGLMLYSVCLLSEILSPLSELEGFKRAFTLFENPIAGIIAGAFVTACLQSSAASVGILQAACAGQSVTLAAAVPIILGQNIGTTFTALVASAGTSLNAKRAAFAHFFINLAGAAVFCALFLIFKFTPASGVLQNPADGAQIAAVHTWFNVISTVVMLPFIGAIEKLSMTLGKSEAEA